MTLSDRLLATIRDHPDSDGPRLVYADFLEEHGGQSERAELIRVQCELARHRLTIADKKRLSVVSSDEEWDGWNSLRRRERELLDAHALDWTEAMRWSVVDNDDMWYSATESKAWIFIRGTDGNADMGFAFRRGFPVVQCRLEDFYKECGVCNSLSRHCSGPCHGTGNVGHGPALLRAAGAIEAVECSDREPNRGVGEWRLFRGPGPGMMVHPPSNLPESLFDLLGDKTFDMGHPYKKYDTADTANRALSRALLKWAASMLTREHDRKDAESPKTGCGLASQPTRDSARK